MVHMGTGQRQTSLNLVVLGMERVSAAQSCWHVSEKQKNKPEVTPHETAGKPLKGQAQVSSEFEQPRLVSAQAPAWQQHLS